MCMSLPFDEGQPVFHVRTSSSKPPKRMEVTARSDLNEGHLNALAKYLLDRANRRKRVIQMPDEKRKAS